MNAQNPSPSSTSPTTRMVSNGGPTGNVIPTTATSVNGSPVPVGPETLAQEWESFSTYLPNGQPAQPVEGDAQELASKRPPDDRIVRLKKRVRDDGDDDIKIGVPPFWAAVLTSLVGGLLIVQIQPFGPGSLEIWTIGSGVVGIALALVSGQFDGPIKIALLNIAVGIAATPPITSIFVGRG